jgi:hypothetical protein
MKTQLDAQLCRDFPEIFRERNADPRSTAMCWGLECGDGWEPVIRATCERLMSKVQSLRSQLNHVKKMIDSADKSAWTPWHWEFYTGEKLRELEAELESEIKLIPVASQIKEKFGTLRFYVQAATPEQYQILEFAEYLSGSICEDCGAMLGVRLYPLGWHRTLCETHADIQYGERAADYRKNLSCAG